MKKLLFTFTLILTTFLISIGQEPDNETDTKNADVFEIPDVHHSDEGIGGNFNFTNIGDQFLIGMRLKPELSFGKIGFGLDIPLMFDINTGKFRLDEYKDGIGAARIIKYFRFGRKKKDNVYFRIGELRGAHLGFGMLISDYNNSISFEKRKLGFEFDLLFKDVVGLELLYSDVNFSSLSLFGIRPYYKPFGATEIPIIKTFEIGLAYATDYDKSILTQNDSLTLRTNYFLDKGINSFSGDMGLYLLNFNFMRWGLYGQAGYIQKVKSDSLMQLINTINNSHIQNYTNGMGWAVGTDLNFSFVGNLLRINLRAERFWNSDYYISRFYNFSYELNKDARILSLVGSHSDQGMYLKLGASILDKVILHSNIIFEDKINETHPAEIYLGLDLSNIFEDITFYTSLHQAHVTDFIDFFEFGDETMFETLLAWTFYEAPVIKLQLTAGVDFKWTYAFLSDMNFEATHYVSPFFSLNIPLNKEEEEHIEGK